MSITNLGTTQAAQTLAAGTTTTAPAASGQGSFGRQLQSALAGQSTAGSGSTTATAYQTEPGRGAPGNAHHHRGHHASDTGATVANGTTNGQTTASAQSGTGGTSATNGAGQQTPGGLLLNDLMRGLQAYGATTSMG
jgi:hypothetical protein